MSTEKQDLGVSKADVAEVIFCSHCDQPLPDSIVAELMTDRDMIPHGHHYAGFRPTDRNYRAAREIAARFASSHLATPEQAANATPWKPAELRDSERSVPLTQEDLLVEALGHLRAIVSSLYKPETYGPIATAMQWLEANAEQVKAAS
jgi:hypothetical protein